jgi:hypothetical protein
MKCMIHEAELEQPYPEGTILEGCTYCVADLTGQSDWAVDTESRLARWREAWGEAFELAADLRD